ncbi:M48 family metalloprotease [Altererythrobacter sp. CAU 1778]
MPKALTTRAKALALATTASMALSGCAATGLGGSVPSAGTPITTSEAQQGAEAHPQILAEFGGEVSGPAATYVEGIGKNIAVRSGLGGARDSFNVSFLNSSVNNAFAVPGGYIYVTRQLAALMNNEAEMAAVLGHEVGHVAARHSQRRQANAQQNSLLGAIGAILTGVVLGDSSIAQGLQRTFLQGSQLLTLKFSRSQELEADQLGIQYLNSAGYDPKAMSTLLASLAAQNTLDARLQGRDSAQVPAWASTHPDPASRVSRASQLAAGGTGTINRDTYLTRMDGIIYGDDPQQGVIEGRQFIHPDLRLSFTAPSGFYMVNGTRAVTINGQSGQAQFSTGQYNGNLETYARQVFQAIGGNQQNIQPSSLQRTTINGIPAVIGQARVAQQNGSVDVTVVAYEFSNNQAYHFAALTRAGGANVFNPMFQSMRKISTQEAANVVPRRLDVVTAGSSDTIQTLARRMAYSDAQVERFMVLNGLSSSERIQPGQKYKVVVRSR